jgi:hypothetical protein
MNYMYEKFKRSDRPDRFCSLDITVSDFLSVVGEKFFNDYLRIDTKRFLNGYILMTIGSVFFSGTRTFAYKLKNNRKS